MSIFKLPRELRDQIYKYVLGNRLIHLTSTRSDGSPEFDWRHKGTRTYHTLCRLERTEEYFHKQYMAERHLGINYDPPHGECHAAAYHRAAYEAAEKLDLRLLQVCKQIFAEARLIPFYDNTFSIDCPDILERLMVQLLPDQISAIRTLLMIVSIDCHSDVLAWWRAFEQLLNDPHRKLGRQHSQVGGLKLHTIHISLRLHFYELRTFRSLVDNYPDFWAAGFLWLRKCPLRKATISLTHANEEWLKPMNGKEIANTDRLTDGQIFCQRLSEKLLIPATVDYEPELDPKALEIAYTETDEANERELQFQLWTQRLYGSNLS